MKIPQHVAIILDGNGRWAKSKGMPRNYGHTAGAKNTEVVDSTLDGCKKVFAYYGSSTYDTKEMSRLIDSVIQDCAALQIETIPPSELDMLLKEWGKSSAKQK